MLTPSDVRRLLDRHGLAPRKADGQNFVVDPNTVRKIVRDADLEPGDTVVEVGPGLGSLTLALSAAVSRVVAIEVDSGLAAVLGDEVLAGLDNVEVVHADALGRPLAELAPGDAPLRVVANLPYNIATPLVFHLLDDPRVSDLFVMVQREVGERWSAGVGDASYGAVSVKLRLVAEVEVAGRVSRNVFVPQPNVDSVMVRIVRRPDAPGPEEAARIAGVVDAAFSQRRKTLRNTLSTIVARERVEVALADLGIALNVRAEELDVDRFVALAHRLAAEA